MDWFLSPLSWIFLGVMFLSAATLSPRFRSSSRGIGILFLAAGYAGITPAIANRMVRVLEAPTGAPQECKHDPPRQIVVLAGGSDRPEARNASYSALGLSSRRRLDRAYAAWMKEKNAVLILSGRGELSGNARPEAEMMSEYMLAVGIPASAIRIDPNATTTWESAINVASMLGRDRNRIALVTSAWHMTRATYAFRAAGFQVCPIPTDYAQIPIRFPASLLPRSTALWKSELVMHELMGIAYYRFRATHGEHP